DVKIPVTTPAQTRPPVRLIATPSTIASKKETLQSESKIFDDDHEREWESRKRTRPVAVVVAVERQKLLKTDRMLPLAPSPTGLDSSKRQVPTHTEERQPIACDTS